MAGLAKENLLGGSLKHLFVYFKILIFRCSYRIYIYIYIYRTHGENWRWTSSSGSGHPQWLHWLCHRQPTRCARWHGGSERADSPVTELLRSWAILSLWGLNLAEASETHGWVDHDPTWFFEIPTSCASTAQEEWGTLMFFMTKPGTGAGQMRWTCRCWHWLQILHQFQSFGQVKQNLISIAGPPNHRNRLYFRWKGEVEKDEEIRKAGCAPLWGGGKGDRRGDGFGSWAASKHPWQLEWRAWQPSSQQPSKDPKIMKGICILVKVAPLEDVIPVWWGPDQTFAAIWGVCGLTSPTMVLNWCFFSTGKPPNPSESYICLDCFRCFSKSHGSSSFSPLNFKQSILGPKPFQPQARWATGHFGPWTWTPRCGPGSQWNPPYFLQ